MREKKLDWTARWDYDGGTVVATGRIRSTRPGLGWASRRAACVEISESIAAFALAALLAASPASAQKGSNPSSMAPPSASGPVAQPSIFPDMAPDPFSSAYARQMMVGELSGEVGRLIDIEACNSWTESGVHSPTVSAKRLAIPGKAAGEYQKGCGAFRGKRWLEAEDHLRRAIDAYPDYAAAWVVLGQVLVSEKKSDDARGACSKAAAIDPGYVASYLCLAEFAANDSDWPEVAKISEQALAIDPIGNPYSLYYAAAAGFHQNQLTQAEMHAQAAVKLDEWHHLPELHLLLAQIYSAAGNVVGEATQLRQFLKVAANSKDAAQAKSMLTLLETTPAKASTPAVAQPGK
jgi:tetratricopeptide (TPR) repeat protein